MYITYQLHVLLTVTLTIILLYVVTLDNCIQLDDGLIRNGRNM